MQAFKLKSIRKEKDMELQKGGPTYIWFSKEIFSEIKIISKSWVDKEEKIVNPDYSTEWILNGKIIIDQNCKKEAQHIFGFPKKSFLKSRL